MGTKNPDKQPPQGDGHEPHIDGIKSELGRLLKSQGEATIPLSLLRQAWARQRSPFFLLRPRLEALANELHCQYKVDKESGNTTFFRRKSEQHKD